MRAKRKTVSKSDEAFVLVESRRRCCLCLFLDGRDEAVRGQIAHIDRDRTNSDRNNLVYLCFDHHESYDGRTSQSKGYTIAEIRTHRDRLYELSANKQASITVTPTTSDQIRNGGTDSIQTARALPPPADQRPWRFPLWQISDRLELFAYKAGTGADGVCLLETIFIPDGRTVIACLSAPGNPGQSITNCVEQLCAQVCERFEIRPSSLVWLEAYPEYKDAPWHTVKFARHPPDGPFSGPEWIPMTDELWSSIMMRPKRGKKLRWVSGEYESPLRKLFPWPRGEAIFSIDEEL